MEEIRLSVHLKNTPEQVREARKKRIKLIGYFPGSYVPEELIYASGAIPVCLTRGGNASPAEAGLKALPRVMCVPSHRYYTGCRTSVGDALLIKEAVEKEVGIPVLLLEWENFDPRYFDYDQYGKKLETFKGMMFSGKSSVA